MKTPFLIGQTVRGEGRSGRSDQAFPANVRVRPGVPIKRKATAGEDRLE
jgi:hypothetical protein